MTCDIFYDKIVCRLENSEKLLFRGNYIKIIYTYILLQLKYIKLLWWALHYYKCQKIIFYHFLSVINKTKEISFILSPLKPHPRRSIAKVFLMYTYLLIFFSSFRLAVTVTSLSLFVAAKNHIHGQRLENMKVRERMRKSNQGDYGDVYRKLWIHFTL